MFNPMILHNFLELYWAANYVILPQICFNLNKSCRSTTGPVSIAPVLWNWSHNYLEGRRLLRLVYLKGPTWNSNPNLNQNQDISYSNCIKVGVKIQNVHCMYFESKVIVTMMTSSKLKNANIWCSKRDRPWNIRLKNY